MLNSGAFLISKQAALLAFLLIVSLLLTTSGCSNNNPDENIESATSEPSIQVITIGNLTDVTGPASTAMSLIDTSLKDLVDYYNENNLIPGVELKIVKYDGQYDSARDVPGYEKLKQQGADVIFTAAAHSAITLQPRLADDDMVLFTVAPTREAIIRNGNVFVPGSPLSEDLGYTLLKWVAENDPDFPKNRPAKVGGAFWTEAYGNKILEGAEKYASDHPEQYDWVKGYLIEFSFDWRSEVEELKNCDYVIPPIPMTTFIEQYHNAGGKAKFLGTHAHDAFIYQIDRANQWDQTDGMYFMRASEWWTDEDSTMVNLSKQLLAKNHPDKIEEIKRMGNGYLSQYNFYVMLEMIGDAVEISGPQEFGPLALFEAADSFSLTIDGMKRESLSEGERISINYLTMYELRADRKDLFRVGPKWNPVVTCP